MSEEQNVLNTYNFNFSVQALDGEVLPSAVFRLVLNVSYGASVGKLQKGYYIKLNDIIYFVSQQTIQVDTTEQATKVFAFLQKTQIPFTVTLKCEKTCSGYQYVRLNDVVSDTFYTLKQFQVFRGDVERNRGRASPNQKLRNCEVLRRETRLVARGYAREKA